MLFHSCGEFGANWRAIRYLESAVSTSEWSWIIEPAAKRVLEQKNYSEKTEVKEVITFGFVGSLFMEFPKKSNARKCSPTLKYNRPKAVNISGFSGESLWFF
jgi:hypothetical protein